MELGAGDVEFGGGIPLLGVLCLQPSTVAIIPLPCILGAGSYHLATYVDYRRYRQAGRKDRIEVLRRSRGSFGC